MMLYYQYAHKIFFLCIGSALCCLVFFGPPVSAQVVHECDASVTRKGFADKILNSVSTDEERIFYTQNNLEKARKSFDTYCCRSGYLDAETCDGNNGKELYNEDLKVIESPYIMSHLLRVVRKYLEGDKNECKRYGLDCETYIDQEANYPGLGVCRKNGADEQGGDPLCESVYDIPKGIDTILADTEPSVPGVISGLYQKVWISGNDIGIKPMPSLDERDPKEYTMTHLLYRTCDEVISIAKGRAQTSERSLPITDLLDSGTRSGKSEIGLCHTYVQQLVTEHANYAIIGSQHAAVYLLDTHRDSLMMRAQELMTQMLDTTNKFVGAVTEVLNRKGDYAPQQCSVS